MKKKLIYNLAYGSEKQKNLKKLKAYIKLPMNEYAHLS